MKVIVYVNWKERKVYSESEYEEEISLRVEKFCADDTNFKEWLDMHYDSLELYNLEGNQKEEVRKAFLKDAREVEEDSGFGWDCDVFTFEV